MREIKTISSIAKIRRGASPRPIGDQKYFGGAVGWVRITDVTRSVKYLQSTEDYLSPLGESLSVRVRSGDLIMSICGTIGRPIIVDMDACIHDGFVQFYDLQNVDTVFFYYVLQFSESDFIGMGQPGTQVNLNTNIAGRHRFYCPPLATQQKIAAVLSAIDKYMEKVEALVVKYKQIKSGLMCDLFGRGILPSGQLRPSHSEAPEFYKDTAIGWIPRDWQYELLDRLATRGSGHTPSKECPEYWNGGVKWISLADSYRLDKLYISDTDMKISSKGIQNSSATLHPAGVVVLSRDAGVGKSAITTEPMAVSQHFMCWKCDSKMDNHFLYYWLQFHKRTFENIAMGSTILTIGLPYFKRLKIACPIDVDEQAAIAKKLKAVDTKLFSLLRDLSKKKQQKLGLMQDLLTGRVPVKVDVSETPYA